MPIVHSRVIVFATAAAAIQLMLLVDSKAQDRCSDLQSMAEMRDCEAKYAELETGSLKTQACGQKFCLIRLNLQQKRGQTRTYAGGGYSFVEGEIFKTGHDQYEFGALLIDPRGRRTIVGQCGGTACGSWYTYVSGPVRDAYLSSVGNSWILQVPK